MSVYLTYNLSAACASLLLHDLEKCDTKCWAIADLSDTPLTLFIIWTPLLNLLLQHFQNTVPCFFIKASWSALVYTSVSEILLFRMRKPTMPLCCVRRNVEPSGHNQLTTAQLCITHGDRTVEDTRLSQISVENRDFLSALSTCLSVYCHVVVRKKLEWCSYPKQIFEDMFTRFNRIHERDRRTDGRRYTARRQKPRLRIASRGKYRDIRSISCFISQMIRHSQCYYGR